MRLLGLGPCRGPRPATFVTIGLAALLAARIAVAIRSPSGLGWDFVAYYNLGLRVDRGAWADIYRPLAPIDGAPPFAYPADPHYAGLPLTALAFAPLGWWTPDRALRLFKALCVVFGGAGALVLAHSLRRRGWLGDGLTWRAAGFVAACLACEPFWLTLDVGGQSTPLAFAVLAVGASALAAGRTTMAGAGLAAAVVFKPFLLPALAVVLLASRSWRLAGALAMALGALAAGSVGLFGLARHGEWLRELGTANHVWAVPWWNNYAPLVVAGDWWLYRVGLPRGWTAAPFPLAVTQAVCRLLALALVARAALQARSAELDAPGRARAIVQAAVLGSLVGGAVSWPHYLLFAAVPLALWLPEAGGARPAARLAYAALALSALRANVPLSGWLAARIDPRTDIGLAAVAAFGLASAVPALVLLWTAPGRRSS